MEIAVVIPALDEAGTIAPAIETAQAPGHDVEVLVVDGGSRDDTVGRARAMGAKVISGPRGRGHQLDTGWRACSGEVVVFLHADTRLAPGWREAIEHALADQRVAGGAFRFRFAERGLLLRLIELGVALRTRLLGLPYGDQALFVRRRILEAAGGISTGAMFEDLDLVQAMRARGRIAALPQTATTSARRYVENGVLRTVARNALALLAWRLGVDRTRVAAWVGR